MNKALFPLNLNETHKMLLENENAVLMAGGTDLMVKFRSNNLKPETIIFLERVEELRRIKIDNNEISIGSGVTYRQILNNDIIKKHAPLLIGAVKTIGAPQIRNMGTIGGNICTASPAGDAAAALSALDASVMISTPKGIITKSIDEFITGPGKNILQKNDILSEIKIKALRENSVHKYVKVGLRKAMAISVVSLAAAYELDESQNIKNISLAWGSIGPKIVKLPELEKNLIGQSFCEETLRGCSNYIKNSIHPISDLRASANYRTNAACTILLKLLDN